MRQRLLALLFLGLLARPAAAEPRCIVGVTTSWDGRVVYPTLSIVTFNIPDDKLEHLVAGATIACLLSLTGMDNRLALMGAATAGGLKEVRDTGIVPGLGRGDVEFADFAWTLAGGAAFVGLRSLWASQAPGHAPAR